MSEEERRRWELANPKVLNLHLRYEYGMSSLSVWAAEFAVNMICNV